MEIPFTIKSAVTAQNLQHMETFSSFDSWLESALQDQQNFFLKQACCCQQQMSLTGKHCIVLASLTCKCCSWEGPQELCLWFCSENHITSCKITGNQLNLAAKTTLLTTTCWQPSLATTPQETTSQAATSPANWLQSYCLQCTDMAGNQLSYIASITTVTYMIGIGWQPTKPHILQNITIKWHQLNCWQPVPITGTSSGTNQATMPHHQQPHSVNYMADILCMQPHCL